MRLFALFLTAISLAGCSHDSHRMSPVTSMPAAQSPAESLLASVQLSSASRWQRREVSFPDLPEGTIYIDTKTAHLYYGTGGGKAMRYGVGIAREGFGWTGTVTIARKAEWPTWVPPAEMLARRPDLPREMKGGPENPLGARALYLHYAGNDTLYRIHGTNEPGTIGYAVSSGCFRMTNEDVIDLYERVQVGTRVIVK